jgi:hypothetical protein
LGKWSSKQEYNEYMRVYMAGRYEKRRSQAIEDLGGKCAECGSGDDLEIDHINPREKSFNLAKAVGFSKKRWDEEVSKCQVLCHDCHKMKHAAKHGSIRKYQNGCRCDPCQAKASEVGRVYKRTYRERLKTRNEVQSP